MLFLSAFPFSLPWVSFPFPRQKLNKKSKPRPLFSDKFIRERFPLETTGTHIHTQNSSFSHIWTILKYEITFSQLYKWMIFTFRQKKNYILHYIPTADLLFALCYDVIFKLNRGGNLHLAAHKDGACSCQEMRLKKRGVFSFTSSSLCLSLCGSVFCLKVHSMTLSLRGQMLWLQG